MSKHKGAPTVKMYRTRPVEPSRADCNRSTEGDPCPRHEPVPYARDGAKHKGAPRHG